jgi:hypothetical protein
VDVGTLPDYPNLPNWTGLPWSLLLVPGWQQLVGQPLHGSSRRNGTLRRGCSTISSACRQNAGPS